MPKLSSIIILLLILTSCVERRIRIESDPPNAAVIVDGKEIGETPAEVPFSFYGTREITIAKKNYYISTYYETIKPPVYQYFPIDFFVENLYPGTVYDIHNFTYTLKPHIPLNNPQKNSLLKRAENLRKESK